MTQLKVYQFATLGLLLLNLVLLAVIALAPARAGLTPQQAVQSLHLDDEQRDRFMTYARTHQAEMQSLNAQQRELLEAYFRQLTTPTAEQPGPPPPAVQNLERKKITSTYQHFLEVKALLRPEQEAQFPDFVDAVLEQILFAPERPK